MAVAKHKIYHKNVRIFYRELKHMHCTPIAKADRWELQFPREEVGKTKSSGWVYSDDPRTYRNMTFESLGEAIVFCKQNGKLTRHWL